MLTFQSDESRVLCRESISCIVTKILFAMPIDEVCDWDDRVKYVKWINVESEERERLVDKY